MTRAIDSKTPEMMPGIATGTTIRMIVFHFGIPKA